MKLSQRGVRRTFRVAKSGAKLRTRSIRRRRCRSSLRRIRRLDVVARSCCVGASCTLAVSRERGLRPFTEYAPRCNGHELLRSFADEANDLRARRLIEAARGQHLRDLLSELTVALQRSLDVLANARGQARAHGRVVGAIAVRQSAVESAVDRAADDAFEVVVGGPLEGCVVCGDVIVDARFLFQLPASVLRWFAAPSSGLSGVSCGAGLASRGVWGCVIRSARVGVWPASRAESLALRCVLESASADASADADVCDGATARRAALSRSAWFVRARSAWLVNEPGCGAARAR